MLKGFWIKQKLNIDFLAMNETINRNFSSKFLKIILLSLIIYFCIFIFISSYKDGVDFILTLFSAWVLIWMFSITGIHSEKIGKPTKYLFPSYLSISICFGIISLIFGLHANLLTSYNKSLESLEILDKYKWMRINNIIDFPLMQLNSENTPPIKLETNFSKLKRNDTIFHLIIIDKTLSLINSRYELNQFLKKNILDVFYVDSNKLNLSKTSDLIPPFVFASLYSNCNSKISNYHELMSLWYYTGEQSLLYLGNDNNDGYTVDVCVTAP